MAYKRQVDRLPIIPADAKEHNVTCHYCIVGCGYKAYTWPVNKQGTATSNKFGVDLGKQQDQETEFWYAPSMYNIVQQDGQDVHLVIKPDVNCSVNSGLGSVRGARMAENRRSDVTGTQQQRLTEPLVWRYGTWQPTSWNDALDLVARVTARYIDKDNEDDLYVSMFDHGGSAGGYENTWGTGKLYFGSMKVKNCRIHNRRPTTPKCIRPRHGHRRAELLLRGLHAHRYDLPDRCQFSREPNQPVSQPHGAGHEGRRPRDHRGPAPHGDRQCLRRGGRRRSRAASRDQFGHRPRALQRALHLHRRSGLGWTATSSPPRRSRAARRRQRARLIPVRWAPSSWRARPAACPPRRLRRSAASPRAISSKAAHWIAEPKADGSRRKCVSAYEKGIIWGNDNYRTIGALVNIGLATGNIGREAAGCAASAGIRKAITGRLRAMWAGLRPMSTT